MRRLILTTLALSLLAAPAAYADTRTPARHEVSRDFRHDAGRVVIKQKADKGRIVYKKTVVKPRWAVGKRVPGWQRKAVRDYNRFGLRKPGRGQEWVRIGNDYLLNSFPRLDYIKKATITE